MTPTEDPTITHARAIVRDARPGFELELANAYLAIVVAHAERKQKREQDEQRARGVR